jgi:hypothetical protein
MRSHRRTAKYMQLGYIICIAKNDSVGTWRLVGKQQSGCLMSQSMEQVSVSHLSTSGIFGSLIKLWLHAMYRTVSEAGRSTCSALVPPLTGNNVIVAKASFSKVLRGAVYLVCQLLHFVCKVYASMIVYRSRKTLDLTSLETLTSL